MTDDRLIILAPQDSVAVVRCGISEGETLIIGDAKIILGGSVSMEDYRLHLKEQERQKRQREGRAGGGTGGDAVQTRSRKR